MRPFFVKGKPVGTYEVKLGEHQGRRAIIHILHGEQYDSMFMSSFGKAGRDSSRKEQVRCGGHVKFYYPNIEAEYYYARGAADHIQCR